MNPQHMVHMANQIARFFASYPREEAIAGIADHLDHFWERRMLDQLAHYIAGGGTGLDALVLEAFKRVKPVAATA